MKKTLTLLWMASALWAAASCSKSEMDIREPETPSEESVESVKVNISVSGLSPDTKAIKKGWESGDIINVYLDDAENINTPDFTLTYDGSSWKASALDASVAARLKTSGGTIYGFWEDSNSCISNEDWKNNQYSWYIQFPRIEGVGSEGHIVADFSVPYTFSVRDRTLTATIDGWKFKTDFQVVVSGLEYTPGRYVLYTEDYYTLTAYEKIRSLSLIYSPLIWHGEQNTPIDISAGDVGGRIIGIENEDGVAFVGQMYSSASRQDFLFYLHDRHTDITYTFEKFGAINYSLPKNKLTTVKIPFSKFYVDLGLSVKWGACNLGATEDPIDGGDYYAWAELEPYYTPGHAGDYTCSSWKTGKTGYNWGSYKYHYSGENEPGWKWMIKYTVEDGQYGGRWWTYNTVKGRWDFIGDGLDTLEPGDDAARQTNGEGWRMPTAAEWQELMDNCTWTWNEDYYNNGIMVTSTVPGYESAKIFLPVVGWREDNKLYEKYGWGAYWSSTINSHNSSEAQSAFFTADKKYIYNNFYRSHGLSVRPVRVD